MPVKKDPFDEMVTSTEADPFEAAGAVPSKKFPTMKQLGTGAPKVKATYAKGAPEEQTLDTTGRLVLITPTAVERKVASNFQGADPADRWTVNLTVFDGTPISEVIDKDGDVVVEFDDDEILTPVFTLTGLYISQGMLAKQLEAKWDNENQRARAKALGRLMQLPKKPGSTNSRPWVLGSFTPEEAVQARAWLKANPEPDAFA